MTLHDFAQLVKRMRDKQKEYFKKRQPSLIEESKRLEKEVDKAVQEIVDPGLFDSKE